MRAERNSRGFTKHIRGAGKPAIRALRHPQADFRRHAATRDAFLKLLSLSFATLAAAALLLLGGCMPLSDEKVNSELFKNKEEMKARTAELAPGMTKAEAFHVLGIDYERFDQLNTEQIQLYVYGRSEVHGTPEQLEEFKRRILAYEGYALPYREIKSKGSIGFAKMKVEREGYDLRLVMIFERGRLLRASVEGNPKVKTQEDQHLWQTILKTGAKAAF